MASSLEEAAIIIEQLEEKLKSVTNERERDKSRYGQQLQFMENENNDLAKKVAERNEKYYDDKKKYSAQVRTLEAEVTLLKSQLEAKQTAAAPSSSSASTSAAEAQWEAKFAEVESAVRLKSREISRLVQQNLTLENTVDELKQQLVQQRKGRGGGNVSDDGGSVSAGEDEVSDLRGEVRMLRRENEDLSVTCRKLRRDEERRTSQLKNQAVLEADVSSARSKIAALESQISGHYAQVEKQQQALLAERSELCALFRGILGSKDNKDKEGCGPAATSVTPAQILQAFGGYQTQCSTQLQEIAELKGTVARLTSQAQKQSGAGGKGVLEAAAAQQQQRLEDRVALLQQQASLFDSENRRLRQALQEYDQECELIVKKIQRVQQQGAGVGTEAVALAPPDIVARKNALIVELQQELDSHRKALAAAMERGTGKKEEEGAAGGGKKRKLEGDEENSSSSSGSDSSATDSAALQQQCEQLTVAVADLRAQEQHLRAELYAFHKAAGIDVLLAPVESEGAAAAAEGSVDAHRFIPTVCSNTRVLHMRNNPYTAAVADKFLQRGIPATVHPSRSNLDELCWLRHAYAELQQKNKQLEHQQQVVGSSSSSAGNTSVSESSILMHGNASSSSSSTSVLGSAIKPPSSASSSSYDATKHNQRLKEVFREKIAQYREAVYLLTGFKVDFVPAPGAGGADPMNASTLGGGGGAGSTLHIRLKSMFAESAEDALMFQYQGSTLELLETPFVQGMDGRFLSYLQSSGSIPAFLCNVTLDLFEKQTMM